MIYGSLPAPVSLTASLAGAAQFSDGTTTISTTLATTAGTYAFALQPAPGSQPGETFTLSVQVAGIELQREGWISIPTYLPAMMKQ
jgi:hypothetical protein